MGLDTSHDCWHGAYSAFNRWRCKLGEVAGYGDLNSFESYGGRRAWPDATDVLLKLFNHSDCDGNLEAAICGSLADRLEQLMPALEVAGDGGGHIGSYADATRRFIAGLRNAAAAGEDVEFH